MNKLKTARNLAGLSQSQLATQAGINIGTLRHYEQGSKIFDHARIATILKVCAALNCRLEDVLEDRETLELLAEYEKKKSR